jgi:hypothetical protein
MRSVHALAAAQVARRMVSGFEGRVSRVRGDKGLDWIGVTPVADDELHWLSARTPSYARTEQTGFLLRQLPLLASRAP